MFQGLPSPDESAPTMNTRLLLPALFAAVFGGLTLHHATRVEASPAQGMGAAIAAKRAQVAPAVIGSFPAKWINGEDCETEPEFQVHPYEPNLYIIRQGKCTTYEAPFMFLIFGDEKALLLDTGAVANSDVYGRVMGIVDQWLDANGKDDIELIVAHTHGHFDHIAADAQFDGAPGVDHFVPADFTALQWAWGFQDYPNDVVTIDLGNRVIEVLGTPGHEPTSLSFYDHNTHLLLTGDIVYPGHLFVFSANHWNDFLFSIDRLAKFARANPVEWLVGCHVETSNTPFAPYGYTTIHHPDEHPLQLHPSILPEILANGAAMAADPQCTIFENYVLHPVYKCGITWNG